MNPVSLKNIYVNGLYDGKSTSFTKSESQSPMRSLVLKTDE